MTVAMAIEKRLEAEIARVLEIMGHVPDRPALWQAPDGSPISARQSVAAGRSRRADHRPSD